MFKTFTPLRYPGGKSQFYKQVVNVMIQNGIKHATYIEPFAGGAGVAMRLLIEGIVDKIIINDIDYAIYAFWDTVLNNNEWICEKIRNVNVDCAEWEKQKAIYKDPKSHSIKDLGFAVLFLNRCNRSGILSAGPIGGKNQTGNYKIDCRFNKENLITIIRMIGMFRTRIQLYNLDASILMEQLKNETNSFWFIDPPYYVKGAELYKNSFKPSDHKYLSEVIKSCLADRAWILTYDVQEEIYSLYREFNHELISLTYTVENKKKENEYLFYNKLKVNKGMLV